ncbi:MAG: DUF4892 domain-containing protein [Cellvibrionaceae bacterium]
MPKGCFCRNAVKRLMVFFTLGIIAVAPFLKAAPLVHYPHATPVIESSVATDDYLLTLGALKKVNGQWRSDREERIGGQLVRNTFELDSGHDVQEVFQYYRQQLIQLGAREVFLCRARGCGSSNSWANNRFGIKQLYGLDQHQHYSVFSLSGSAGTEYVALYGVLRGNKRSYVHVDSIQSAMNLGLFSSSAVIENQLQLHGVFALSDVGSSGVSLAQLNELVMVLRSHSRWQLAVVGINREAIPLEGQLESSRQAAKAIETRLVELGIDSARISSAGIGSLVPASMSVPGARSILFSLVEL